MESAYYLGLARQIIDWPQAFNQRELVRLTRKALKSHGDYEAWSGLAGTEHFEGEAPGEQWAYRIVSSFVSEASLPELDESVEKRAVELHLGLLKELSGSNLRQEERYQRAQNFVLDNLEGFSGWEVLVASSSDYQLDQPKPWWKPGDFFTNEEMRQHLMAGRHDEARVAETLKDKGFITISRPQYLERVRQNLINYQLLKTRVLERPLALMLLYCTPSKERALMPKLLGTRMEDLQMRCVQALQRQNPTVPMWSLYSLPREANNISTFFLAKADQLEVSTSGDLIKGPLERARVKMLEEDDGQQTLFFDTDLVSNKEKRRADVFISVEVDERQPDALGALMRAIEKFDIDRNIFEHLPRVCAGMFAAAQRDRRLRFNSPGTFWDTDSGYRVCRIIGFDPDNPRHRKRVQDARELLQNFILHRKAKGRDENGRKVDIEWCGPIIESRRARITLTVEEREGLSARHNFHSWSIAEELWNMTLLEEEGGTPSFTIIDQRAFELDARTSGPFNIYWTLINRAYNDRIAPDGSFELGLWTLYLWSGLESINPRPFRIRDQLKEALELMLDRGLLLSWECNELHGNTTMENLQKARLRVVFSEQQRHSLPLNQALVRV